MAICLDTRNILFNKGEVQGDNMSVNMTKNVSHKHVDRDHINLERCKHRH